MYPREVPRRYKIWPDLTRFSHIRPYLGHIQPISAIFRPYLAHFGHILALALSWPCPGMAWSWLHGMAWSWHGPVMAWSWYGLVMAWYGPVMAWYGPVMAWYGPVWPGMDL